MDWHCALPGLQQHAKARALTREAPFLSAGKFSLRTRVCCTASCLLLGCGFTVFIHGGYGPAHHGRSLDISGLRALRSFVVGAATPKAGLWAFTSRPSIAWTAQTFPNPRVDPAACGLTAHIGSAPGLICDPDGLLANATRLAIQGRLTRLSLDQPYILGVAIMRDLDVSMFSWPNWHQEESAVDVFTRSLIQRWQLGDGHDGVMLVVVREPDYISIYAQSKAVHRGLNPALCRGIADYGVLPYVDNGYLDRGIVSGVEEIAVALRHPLEPMRPWPLSDKLFILCCLVTCLTSVVCLVTCCSKDDGTEPDDGLDSTPAPQRPDSTPRRPTSSEALDGTPYSQHSAGTTSPSIGPGGPGDLSRRN